MSAPWVESSLTTSSNNGLPHFRPRAYQSSEWCDIWLGRYFPEQICPKKSFHLSPAVTTAIMQIRCNFGQRGRHCWKLFLILPLFTRPLTVLYWIIAFFGFSNESKICFQSSFKSASSCFHNYCCRLFLITP